MVNIVNKRKNVRKQEKVSLLYENSKSNKKIKIAQTIYIK